MADEPVVASRFKIEVTKNTKGFNYVVRVYSDDIEELKEDVTELQEWAEDKYGAK